MNKYKGSLIVVGLALFMTGSVFAASVVRGAKGVKVLTQSTAATPVHSGAVTVYSVILGTGAVTDYTVLLDSANATGAIVGHQVVSTGFRGRFYPSSTSANTNITFDPPLLFKNGLTIINATALGTVGVTYEPGKGL